MLIQLVMDLNNPHSDFCFKIYRDDHDEFQVIRKKIQSEDRSQKYDDYYHLHVFNAQLGHACMSVHAHTHTYMSYKM